MGDKVFVACRTCNLMSTHNVYSDGDEESILQLIEIIRVLQPLGLDPTIYGVGKYKKSLLMFKETCDADETFIHNHLDHDLGCQRDNDQYAFYRPGKDGVEYIDGPFHFQESRNNEDEVMDRLSSKSDFDGMNDQMVVIDNLCNFQKLVTDTYN